MKRLSGAALVGLALLFSTAAIAGLSTGGLVFTNAADIRMAREEQLIEQQKQAQLRPGTSGGSETRLAILGLLGAP